MQGYKTGTESDSESNFEVPPQSTLEPMHRKSVSFVDTSHETMEFQRLALLNALKGKDPSSFPAGSSAPSTPTKTKKPKRKELRKETKESAIEPPPTRSTPTRILKRETPSNPLLCFKFNVERIMAAMEVVL